MLSNTTKYTNWFAPQAQPALQGALGLIAPAVLTHVDGRMSGANSSNGDITAQLMRLSPSCRRLARTGECNAELNNQRAAQLDGSCGGKTSQARR